MPRFRITRFWSGVSSIVINPSFSASLIAARVFALPMLARSAIRATGSEHFPLAWASFQREHGHCVSVQVLSHIGWDDYRRSKKLTTPHYPSDGGFALLAGVAHCEIRSLACLGLNCGANSKGVHLRSYLPRYCVELTARLGSRTRSGCHNPNGGGCGASRSATAPSSDATAR